MAGRKYTAEERAHAAGLAASIGQTAAAEATGIPKTTIHWWMRHEFKELVEKSREQVADQFWIGIQVGVKAVVEGFDSKAPLKDKAVALGVLYDRHALLTGGATARSESRDITGSLSDSELAAALREAERIATGGGSPPPAAEPAEG